MITKNPWSTYKVNKMYLHNRPIQSKIRRMAEQVIEQVGVESGMYLPRIESLEQELFLIRSALVQEREITLSLEERNNAMENALEKAERNIKQLEDSLLVFKTSQANRDRRALWIYGIVTVITLGAMYFL